jgi:hypothetical protein
MKEAYTSSKAYDISLPATIDKRKGDSPAQTLQFLIPTIFNPYNQLLVTSM